MGLLSKKTEEEKRAEDEAKAAHQEAEQQAAAELQARRATHIATLPKWEYQVKRIGEDKQKGLLGSQRMEQILNGEGSQGWELVGISAERATFKRPLPD